MNADGSYTYVADQDKSDQLATGATGTDIFTYTVSDGTETSTAQLTFTVTGVNDNDPVAVDDTDTVKRDASITRASGSEFDIDSDDTDADGETLTISAVRTGQDEGGGKGGPNRVGKTLVTTMDEGDLVKLNCFKNGKDEAIGISDEIEKIKKNFSLNNIAILVRAIFQTREFEERFLKIGLPYRIVGGIKFYERAEIKDCVAYLKVIHQPFDDLSFERIINVPKRSIGDTTIKLINEYAKLNKTTLENAARKLIEDNKIKPKTKLGLSSLLNLLQKWREDLKNKINHNKLLQLVLDESGYSEMLKNKKDLENENRLENIKELLNAMKEFDNLESFLEHVALATSLDQDWETEKVNLMTMHASKGLEFDVVFLPGWEEGLFPHQKSIEEKGENGLEEERRLAYVGITRAKKIAKISFSMNRFYQGDWIDSMSSRFIDELPDENLKKNNNFIDENEDDFEFNQDIEFDEPIRSPGWLRYQKKLNDK